MTNANCSQAMPASGITAVPAHLKAEILIEALPYIQRLAGKTVIVKYGGAAMKDPELRSSVMADVTLLKFIGLNPILVHGGGPEITAMLERMKIPSVFRDGLRVTDQPSMEVAQMVLVGKTNKDIVSRLSRHGAHAIGLCGIDGDLLRCRQLAPAESGEAGRYGYVGEVTAVNAELLRTLCAADYIPVVAPIGVDENGQSYNVNADTAAAEIAVAMRAEKLMTLTDVGGVMRRDADGNKTVIPALIEAEIQPLIDSGTISGGMIPKLEACRYTVTHGVNRVHIIDGRVPHCLLLEIFSHKGVGTMITQAKLPYFPEEKPGWSAD